MGCSVFAQYQIGLVPRQSPDQGVYQKIGYTDVEIRYGSPMVNKREVWGKMVPYDKVWRAGANNATTIEFSEDVRIEGQALPKGKYAFFVIPAEQGKWTLIFSSKAKQWGAFRYKQEDDALRVEVLPEHDSWQEALLYTIEPIGFEYGRVSLKWANAKLSFEIETAYLSLLAKLVEERAAQAGDDIRWVVYVQGAEYLVNQQEDLKLAQQWLEKAEREAQDVQAWNEQFYPKDYVLGHLYWTQAKCLAAQEQYAGAVTYAEKMKALVGDSSFYEKENESEEIDQLLADWKAKI